MTPRSCLRILPLQKIDKEFHPYVQLDLIFSQDKLSIGLILQPILTSLEDVITSYHLILAYDAIISDSSFKEFGVFL